MTRLKVLTIGSNPNVVLYTWRLLESGLVDVYHVSDHEFGQEFSVSTANYGSGRFVLDRHYATVEELEEAYGGFKFEVVIFSACSLQEMSSVACKLDKVIDDETKVFIESSGYVHLEPFVRLSANVPQLKVFSIMTDTDFRKMGRNTYEQFNANRSQTIFLGQSGLKSKSVSTRYSKDISTVLVSFQSFFEKLFPHHTVDLCSSSYLEFLLQQWKLAIPQICFDPLLILMEELKPLQLKEQVLAKPLISGFVTEIITVSRSMGVKLPAAYGSESELFSNWVEMNKLDVPKLVHQFLYRRSSMNIDMLLLQPILLADDHGIKTPYLEFLYSMMCQFQRINDGNSLWFKRKEVYDEVKDALESVTAERNRLASELESLKNHFSHKEASWNEEVQRQSKQSTMQIQQLHAEIDRLKEELFRGKKSNSKFIYGMQARGTVKDALSLNGSAQAKSSISEPQIDEQTSIKGETTPTGTPNLQDIQEFALYGINYNDAIDDENINLSPSPVQNGIIQEDVSMTPPETRSTSDHSLQERELEIKRRETMLQERELQLQRKIQHSNSLSSNFIGQPLGQPLQNVTQPMFLRRASKTNPLPLVSPPLTQPKSNGNFNKKVVMTSRANSLVEPFAPQTLGAPMQQPYIQSLKKTDRKTRQMTRIRNASSTGLNDFSMHGNNLQGSGRGGLPFNQARSIMSQTQRLSSQTPSSYSHYTAASPMPMQKHPSTGMHIESIPLTIIPQFPPRGMRPSTPTSQPLTSALQATKEAAASDIEEGSISVKLNSYTTASGNPVAPIKPTNGFEMPNGNSATNSGNGYITPDSSNNSSSLSNESSVQPPAEHQQLQQPPDKQGWKQTPPSSSGSGDRKLKLAIFSEKRKQKT